jgi:hypothetical protein
MNTTVGRPSKNLKLVAEAWARGGEEEFDRAW